MRGKLLKQRHGKVMVVQNPPMEPLTTSELDRVYSLPYMRAYHPSYEKLGGVPGIEEVRFSITHNRDVSALAISVPLHSIKALCDLSQQKKSAD